MENKIERKHPLLHKERSEIFVIGIAAVGAESLARVANRSRVNHGEGCAAA